MPIAAVTDKSIQQGAYEKTAAKPSKADPKPPAKIGATIKRYTNAYRKRNKLHKE